MLSDVCVASCARARVFVFGLVTCTLNPTLIYPLTLLQLQIISTLQSSSRSPKRNFKMLFKNVMPTPWLSNNNYILSPRLWVTNHLQNHTVESQLKLCTTDYSILSHNQLSRNYLIQPTIQTDYAGSLDMILKQKILLLIKFVIHSLIYNTYRT